MMSLGDTLSRDFGGDDPARNEVNSTSRALRFRRYLDAAMLASKASQRAARACESTSGDLIALSGRGACCRGEPHC